MIQALEVATVILERALSVEVVLQAQRQVGWAGNDAWHCGAYLPEQRLVKINFRNLEGATSQRVLQVLGHEMRHAFQYQHGLMNARHRWEGLPQVLSASESADARYRRYFNRPWEVDARRHQSGYADLVIQHADFMDHKNALDVDGAVPLKRDHVATYAALGFAYPNDEVNVFRLSKNSDTSYWMHISQIDGAKKWTPRIVRKAFEEYRQVMSSQPIAWVMVPIDLEDMVC